MRVYVAIVFVATNFRRKILAMPISPKIKCILCTLGSIIALVVTIFSGIAFPATSKGVVWLTALGYLICFSLAIPMFLLMAVIYFKEHRDGYAIV
jgi:hypothetical protein